MSSLVEVMALHNITSHKTNSVMDNSCKPNKKIDLVCYVKVKVRSIFPNKLNGDFHEYISDCEQVFIQAFNRVF